MTTMKKSIHDNANGLDSVSYTHLPRKVLCIPCDADFGIDNFFFTAMIPVSYIHLGLFRG